MHTHSLAEVHGVRLPRRLAGRGRAHALLGEQAGKDRVRFRHLSRQHQSPGLSPTPRRNHRFPGCTLPRSSRSEAVARRYRKVGLLGTRWLRREQRLSRGSVTAQGVSYLRPELTEREEISRIIMEELVYGVFKPRRSPTASGSSAD